MSIENRDLSDGMKLVAKYKGEVWKAEVGVTDDGLQVKLEDGRLFKSVSSAGSAVMGGNACNGWRFWSLADGSEPAPKTTKRPKAPPKKAPVKASPKAPSKKPVAKKAKVKTSRFGAIPPTDDQPEDVTRYYCEACADAFTVASANAAPAKCPQGHKPGQESV